MRKTMFAFTLLAATAAIPALAGGHGGGMMDHSKPITRAQVEAMVKARFQDADANKDGVVTAAEHDAVRAARMKAMHDEKFQRMDSDRNGQVSKAEFDAFHTERMKDMADNKGMKPHHGGRKGHGMGHGFAKMDSNKDGKLTLDEAMARPMEMFARADANKDGTVTPEEHQAAMATMMKHHDMKHGTR